MSKVKQWAWDCAEKAVDKIILQVKQNLISKEQAKIDIMNVQNVDLCSIDEHNVDEVIELELRGCLMTKDGTIHLSIKDNTMMMKIWIISLSIILYSEMWLSQLNRLNNKDIKQKVKEFCDKNYNETDVYYNDYSEVNMITGDEYYKTYGDEFGDDGLQK